MHRFHIDMVSELLTTYWCPFHKSVFLTFDDGKQRFHSCLGFGFIPQIAIAIGVLTSNRGEGDEPLLRIGRGTRMPLQGAVDVVPLHGAIVVCYGWGGIFSLH